MEENPTTPPPTDRKQSIAKILGIIAFLTFIFMVVNAITAMGFMDERASPGEHHWLSLEQVWWVNTLLGVVVLFLVQWHKPITAIITGVVLGLSVTGVTYGYLSWRESFINYEILLILILAAIPPASVYNVLHDKIKY